MGTLISRTQKWWLTAMPSSKCQLASEFHHVVRENNQAADILARIGAKRDPVPLNIFLERLFKPSVVWEGETANNSPDPATTPDPEHSDVIGGSATEITPSAHVIMAVIASWTEPFLAYLTRQELPEDPNEARCIVRRSKAYKVHEGELYKKRLPESFKGASPKRKEDNFWQKFMLDLAATTP